MVTITITPNSAAQNTHDDTASLALLIRHPLVQCMELNA